MTQMVFIKVQDAPFLLQDLFLESILFILSFFLFAAFYPGTLLLVLLLFGASYSLAW